MLDDEVKKIDLESTIHLELMLCSEKMTKKCAGLNLKNIELKEIGHYML